MAEQEHRVEERGGAVDEAEAEAGAEVDALAALKSEYVQGRTKRTVTAASALNELRLALEAVSSRVAGKKPEDGYKPRTRSRADKGVPEELTADVGDGTRIDAVQLIQELAVIVREIVQAPSAKKASGGSVAESGPVLPGPLPDGPPNLPDPVAQPIVPAEIGQARPNATFGGAPPVAFAPVAVVHAESTVNAPDSPPAMIGPGRDAFDNATFGGAAPVAVAFQGPARAAAAHAAPAMIGQARAPLTSQGRAAAAIGGGAAEIKGPDRAAYAQTREQYGGVAPVHTVPTVAVPVIENIEPDAGDFRVIQLPEP